MIPRTLVPRDLRPVREDAAKKPPRRLTTLLDERTVVPTGLSSTAPPIDGKTSIPAHFPLDVLVERTLIPRSLEPKPLEKLPPLSEYVPLAVLDHRVVVPAFVEPAAPEEIEGFEHPPEITPDLLDLVQPDIFTTGEPNLLASPEERKDVRWEAVARALSVLAHCAMVAFLFYTPKLFPPHQPTRAEIELARRQLSFVYLPPDVDEVAKIPPKPQPPSPKIRISPDILRKIAPPAPETMLRPEGPPINPERAPSELPSAPTPQPAPSTQPSPPASRLEPVRPPQSRPGSLNLSVPQVSPGRALQEDLQSAIRRGGVSVSSGGALPQGPGGGGGGQGYLGNQVQMLTPTEGVDFSSYLTRLLASVKRNWYAIIPESARMGDKGRVIIQFHIVRDGNVPFGEPLLIRTSGKEPLDTAAMAAIRASNPFEPLPPAFSGPNIELRIIFLYNLPLDYAQ